ncbi:hypothetical protein WKV44_05695 [Spirochaetia bacterium 38H-sp]|uniref:Uncharacterized protein n=1 Tax=Rarispira pelagica TaxID=3141764 RepID=A0ABU9UC09_9SPIR
MKKIAIITAVFFIALSAFAQEDFSFFDTISGTESSMLKISGNIDTELRFFTDPDKSIEKQDIAETSGIGLDISYDGQSSRAIASLSYDQSYDFTTQAGRQAALSDMIKEAYIQLFLSWATIDIGYKKIVWGKGDKVHTFDTINPTDYTDFINPDYLDRKKAENMLHITIALSDFANWEIVYVPSFTPDIFPQEGKWVQYEFSSLSTAIEDAINQGATAYATTVTADYMSAGFSLTEAQTLAKRDAQLWAAQHAEQALVYDNPEGLDSFIAASRINASFAGIDMGLSYQYTYDRLPVIDTSKLSTNYQATITYNRLQLIGAELATAPAGFNIKAEAAYFLTEDTDGTDPLVRNNRIAYLAGVDKDIIPDININLQITGSYVLGTDNIKKGDTDYNADSKYSTTIINAGLTGNMLNNNLYLEAAGAYQIETTTWMLRPRLEYNIDDNTKIGISYTYYAGDKDTLFGQFNSSSFLKIYSTIKF